MKQFLLLSLVFFFSPNLASAEGESPNALDGESKANKKYLLGMGVGSEVSLRGFHNMALEFSRTDLPWMYGLRAEFARGTYKPLNVYQTSTFEYLDSALAESRDKNKINFLSIGPQVGLLLPLFESDHWFELGKTSLSYSRFTDDYYKEKFSGAAFQFQGAIAYKASIGFISLGASYNLAYLHLNSPSYAPPHTNFLPLQWWAFEANFSFFIF